MRDSVIIQMSSKPSSVPFWVSVPEWLPGFCAELNPEGVLEELSSGSPFVFQRLGYLIQNIRPDIADDIYKNTKPKTTRGSEKERNRYDTINGLW